MYDASNIVVRQWLPTDSERTIELFSLGEELQYSDDPKTREAAKEFIKYSISTDLNNIPLVYFNRSEKPRGCFWVAEDVSTGLILGIVGLEYKNDQEAELRRMFVDRAHKGKGIGSLLIKKLIEFAIEEGYQSIHLQTLANATAQYFYKKHGFTIHSELTTGLDDIVHLLKMAISL